MTENMNLINVPFEGLEDETGKRHVYVSDMDTGVTRWSKSAVECFGLDSEYNMNMSSSWSERVHPADREKYLADIGAVLSGKKSQHNVQYRALNKYGEYIPCTCKGRVVTAQDGKSRLFIGTLENHEISSGIDSVTGLCNVFAFLKDAVKYREELNGHNLDMFLMLVGLNRFSDINKNFGYDYGNKILKQFATQLLDNLSEADKVYRMDGAKFCLIIPIEKLPEAEKIYGRICKIAQDGFDIEGKHASFSISGGIVDVENISVSEYSIQASMEYVLELSKRRRHGELVFFSKEIFNDNHKNLIALENIRNSVFKGMEGFYLCYQPVINPSTGRIKALEALLRWNKEPIGEVPPGLFIPWLENDPCFYELGNWVLKKAVSEAKKIVEADQEFVVNVNVSAEQIERSGFRNSVMDILKEENFPPQNLCMELTERVMSLDMKFLKGELEFFRSLGIKVALDDFGTGVSSLNLLLELPVDYLKIDRMFVKDIITNKVEQKIVETIAFCAERLDLEICVEGVETEEMKDFLGQYRVSSHQGFLYSRPVVMNEFLKVLNKYNGEAI